MRSRGETIGEYVIEELVAAGGTCEVFRVKHRERGTAAALKVLLVDCCIDEQLVKRFLNEAISLQHVEHPHIVSVLDCAVLGDGRPYMVLEWLPTDLHRALARVRAPLAPHVVVRLGRQIAAALHVLHHRGLVHRDLKPANVLLSDEDITKADIKLADLGLAKLHAASVGHGDLPVLHVSTGQQVVFGTWEYMAPEQWVQAKTVDAKVDVYSLGVLLFQMLSGRLPFIASEEKDWMYFHVIEAPPLQLLEGRGPVSLGDLVRGMLSKKAAHRPTMLEVAEQLANFR